MKLLLGLFLTFNFIINCKSPKTSDNEQKLFPGEKTETCWEISTPEEQGITSSLLVDMIKEIQDNELKIRSVLIIKNGHLVLECYVFPYDSNVLHDVKSVSKSIISALTGIALRENILKNLDQNVYDYFPEYFPKGIDPEKKEIKLKHLLMMATGLSLDENGPIMAEIISQNNLMKATLSQPVTNKAGEQFNYCTLNTHVLSGVLTKASGCGLLELATQYIFEPLGIKNVHWEKDEQGYYFGGDKLWLTPRDMAKFGYLFLNKGKWEDKQILPEGWVIESTTNKFANFIDRDYTGYGYGWWLTKDGGYRARGFGGQIISVHPQWNMIVVFTGGDNFEWQKLFNKYILPSVSDKKSLPVDNIARKRLKSIIRELKNPKPHLPPPLPKITEKISGKKYFLKENDLDFSDITLWFEKENECRLVINYDQHILDLAVGLDHIYRISSGIKWGMKPDNNILALRGKWINDNTFYIDLHEVGEPFYFDIELNFNKNKIRPIFVWQPIKWSLTLEGKLE